MIRVAKSASVPALLTNRGIPATVQNCQLYDANSADYDTGKATFDISPSIYGDESVKDQLKVEQHNKCCFCEADFTANGYGDVEHFRPKLGFTITRSSKLIRPGYYWLGYEWSNLFFSCQICNQRFKKNYFPLDNEAHRAKNHTFDYHNESPVLLHPSLDEPADHISFNRHVPVAKTNRGKASITGYGIDRPALNRVRESYLQNVRNIEAFAKINLLELTANDRQQLSRMFNLPWPDIEKSNLNG